MGFWVVIFICELLVPLLMIISGILFINGNPGGINSFFGYRTAMSMKNEDTWHFAHLYCGKLWLKIGAVMLPVTVLLSVISIGKTEDFTGIFGTCVIIAQAAVIIFSTILVERKLKRVFDKNGSRIN